METANLSKGQIWTGRVMSGLVALFMLFDAVMKFVKPIQVVEGTTKLGYPVSCITGLGVVLLVSTILYIIPRTAFIGTILLTGYLGGAVATHVRVSASWFNILFPVVFGCIAWG